MEIGHFKWLSEHKVDLNIASSGMIPVSRSDVEKLGEPTDIMEALSNIYNVSTKAIALTHGTQEGNFAVLSAIKDAVDQVITVVPEYEPIRVLPSFLGLRRIEVKVNHGLSELINYIKPRSALFFSNPNNPLGMHLSRGEIRDLADEARRKGSYLIIDSIFLEFVTSDLRDLPLENTAYTFSTSKFYTVDSFKVGWIIGDEELIRRAVNVINLVSPLVIGLEASYVSIMLQNRDWFRRRNLSIISPNRESLMSISESLGNLIKVTYFNHMPIAYVTTKCNVDSLELANELLRRGVLTVPGFYFGINNGIRIGLGSVNHDTFTKALNVMVNVITGLCTR
ncbi:pyridoxal phosphate-dependent aminotransferase [Caldivirga maquilingensis]|uniref:Aminotransferase class I and II n=1 Tax=Caldivirga maquilingensis (strain ATCC 700844 / DSM 13496 / JCM 10307 / IC-167) TaxID=397948 RepID=A8MAZ3_CALMQ|nr:pyridoxal phosphate-dependent aminotransferase [Caldivirga maquilingensis]ABW02622.1 aminotransferase class I and II [Caldivirga maquilingensis IC-167]